MRIGISCYSTYGGSGVVATEVGKALASKGHEVHILSPSIPPRLVGFEDHVIFHEVSASPYPLFETDLFSIALASKMADAADRHHLDIIHAHYAIPHASAALLARMALEGKIKVVTTLHGTDITAVGSDPSYLPMVRLAIKESDAVTVVSDYLKDQTLKTFGVSRQIDVVYNFACPPKVDENAQCSRDCRDWLSPDGEPILAHVSNFRPVKRVMDVLRVFEAVRQSHPCKLVMVGDGPDRLEAENYAREKNMEADVRFTGKLLDIDSVLSCTDIFLLPSSTESFGLAALEAMSHGAPIVASRAGGIPEVVRDGVDGYLSDVGDITGMAESVSRLLADPELRQNMGRSAKKRALNDFAEGPIVEQYEEIYRKVLSGKP
ncbi:MAG: N-acetyl-alpha-D-glucosaminyl L-malate synthase BshA [Holophagales bacterium]|jgi:N-acetyl-alpha-D-glucosaminyl L-malate synthase BshA|nr:N-acetyl-alpha-D-glucosaminyl L-malate synthase BshA [Holophagales bacterium]